MDDETKGEVDLSWVDPAHQMDETEIQTRTIQRQGRVDLPEEWLDEFGWEESDTVHIIAERDEEKVTIKRVKAEDIL